MNTLDATFADGTLALEAMQTEQPGWVLTDRVMPKIDGLQVCKAIKDQWPQVPVVLMSGYPKQDIRDRLARMEEIVPLLRKPLGRKDLIRVAPKHLAERSVAN